MKGVLIAIISIAVLILGIIVGVTYLFGRKDGSGPSEKIAAVRGGGDLGVFVSRNGGESWQQEVKFGRSSIAGIEITDIVFHAKEPGRVYAATIGNGLLTTASTTEGWTRVTGEENVLAAGATIYQIALSPGGDSLYLAAAANETGRLYRSSDGGKSFEELYQTAGKNSGVHSVALDPQNPARLYIGTSEGGVLASEDRGESWGVVRWFKNPVGKVYIHPQSPNLLFITFLGRDAGKLARSQDGGKTWEELSISSSRFGSAGVVYMLAFDPQNAAVLYLSAAQGVFRSADGGKTWKELPLIVPPKLLPVLAVTADPRDPKRLYVAAASQVYKSEDGGERWQVHKLPTTKNIRVLEIAPDNSDVLWAGIRK